MPIGKSIIENKSVSQKEQIYKIDYDSNNMLRALNYFSKGTLAYIHRFILKKKYLVSCNENPQEFDPLEVQSSVIKKHFLSPANKNNYSIQKKDEGFKIIIFNTEYSRDPSTLIKLVKKYDADFVLLSEVDKLTIRNNGEDTPNILSQELKMNYIFYPEFWELDEHDGNGLTGNMILSRYKFKDAGFHILKNYFPWNDWKYEKRIGSRNFVYATLEINKSKILLISTHLEDKSDNTGRIAQMREIINFSKKYYNYEYIIIGGDLNTRFKEEDQKMISLMEENGFEYKKIGRTWKRLNFLPTNIPLELDKFFLKNNKGSNFKIEVLKQENVESDHYPLLIEIE